MQVILQFVTDLFCVALFFPAFFDGQKLTNVEKLVKKPIFNAASWLNLPSWSSNMGPGQMQFTSDSAKNVSRRRMQTRFADASHGVCACRRVSRLSALLRRSYVLGGVLHIVLSVCRDIMSIYKEPPPGMFVVPDPQDMTKVKSRTGSSGLQWNRDVSLLFLLHFMKHLKGFQMGWACHK